METALVNDGTGPAAQLRCTEQLASWRKTSKSATRQASSGGTFYLAMLAEFSPPGRV
jgi:hypothetical protein